MASGLPWSLPHPVPPVRRLVVMPYPGSNPASRSWADGVQPPVMAAWHDGLGGHDVIQNQMAVLNATTGSVDTRSGSFSRSSPNASPARQ